MSHQLVRATAKILSATRLLAAEEAIEGEEATAPDLKVSGMPKKFWVVMAPSADQELENVAVEMSFAEFMDKVKNGLEQSALLGIFKRKGDAHSVAKKALRKVKSEAKEAAEEAEKQAKEAAEATEFAEQEAGEAEEAADEAQEAAGEETEGEPEGEPESVAEAALKAVAALRAAVHTVKAGGSLADAVDTLQGAVDDYEIEMENVSSAISDLVGILTSKGSGGSQFRKWAEQLENLDPDRNPLEELKSLAEHLSSEVDDIRDDEEQAGDLRDAVLELLEGSDYKERKDYSGRGMYGKISPLAFVTDIPPNSTVGQELLDIGLVRDDMGKQHIYYLG